ncbi:MAG: DUF2071 domain-containing protein [Cytophagales bacterium]|nr:MAG: DUF2071 domain-containing protein [Cytophagales bacterium]TAF62489.1 MAG: DUF2071 domain-containing protein [Cytophagales bacterium]
MISQESPIFLSAEWRKLLMLNFEVDSALLQPYLPKGVEIDYFEGRTFVSVVGFMFENTQLKGFKIPFHQTFEEVNLRFYTRYMHEGEWKRGVCFVRELVPKAAISWVANAVYHEPYLAVPMWHKINHNAQELSVLYGWDYANEKHEIMALAEPKSQKMQEGSLNEFIAEHYWGFGRHREEKVVIYQVEHPRWEFYPVRTWQMQLNTAKLYGQQFVKTLAQEPVSVFVAEGSPIHVRHALFV